MKREPLHVIVLDIMASIGFPVLETDLARMIPEMYPGRMALPSTISRCLRKLAESGRVVGRLRVVDGHKKPYKEWLIVESPLMQALKHEGPTPPQPMIPRSPAQMANSLLANALPPPAVQQPAPKPYPDAQAVDYEFYTATHTGFSGIPWAYFASHYQHIVADYEKKLVWC